MKTRDRVIVIGCLLAVVVLAVQVWRLERQVGALSQQLESAPRAVMIPTAGPQLAEPPQKRKIFRLLESDGTHGGVTEIGVPWTVEHAMLIEGAKSEVSR
jgi:hypothetical protein